MTRPDWMREAACIDADPEAFFPEKGDTSAQAKAICARCDVSPECLTYALEHNITYGTWGGTSERERRSMQRRRQSRALRPCGTPAAYTRHLRRDEAPCGACREAHRQDQARRAS